MYKVEPTQPGEKDLLLGESHRIDLGHGILADVYTKHRVMRVETPIEAFTVTGLRTITVGPDRVEFHAVRNNYAASLTLLPDGTLLNEVKPIAPLPGPATTPLPIPSPHTEIKPAPEAETLTVKGNLGTDPRTVTTEQGQMYFFAFGIHQTEGKTPARTSQKAEWVKVAVPLGQEALIIDAALASDENPLGLRLRKGDFTQLTLTPGQWKQIAVANKETGQLSTKIVSGYFLSESTLLKQKQR